MPLVLEGPLYTKFRSIACGSFTSSNRFFLLFFMLSFLFFKEEHGGGYLAKRMDYPVAIGEPSERTLSARVATIDHDSVTEPYEIVILNRNLVDEEMVNCIFTLSFVTIGVRRIRAALIPILLSGPSMANFTCCTV